MNKNIKADIVKEVTNKTHAYARKGGKDNRAQQRSYMLMFAKSCRGLGATSMKQVGRKHVIQYWKNRRELSDRTLMNHWYALSELWSICEMPNQPPLPRLKSETGTDCSEYEQSCEVLALTSD